jgi:hypothetical protein
MVRLFVLASRCEACEIALAARLDAMLDAGRVPELAELEMEFAAKTGPSVDVAIPAPSFADYNRPLPSICEGRLS